MSQRMTRRRFGELVVTGSIGAGILGFANKTLGQVPVLVVGVVLGATRTGNIPTNLDQTEVNLEVSDTPETDPFPLDLGLRSLNISNGLTQDLPTSQVLRDGTSVLKSGEQLTGLASLAKTNGSFPQGSLIVGITPVSASKKGNTDDSTRLIVLGSAPTTLTVSGLKKGEKLASLAAMRDGSLKGLVVKEKGRSRATLVDISLKTGAVTPVLKLDLPGREVFNTLAECPDGKFYTTTVGSNGETNLVQIDVKQKKVTPLAELKAQSKVWNNGLHSLLCSPSGQFLALGGQRYEPPSMYLLDPTTGAMTQPVPFDVAQAVLSLA